MVGRAMPTTVASIAAMPEPRTVATMTQRPAVEAYATSASVDAMDAQRMRVDVARAVTDTRVT
jgi:hypothetical protein